MGGAACETRFQLRKAEGGYPGSDLEGEGGGGGEVGAEIMHIGILFVWNAIILGMFFSLVKLVQTKIKHIRLIDLRHIFK